VETSLHRQLKELYADDPADTEVTLGDYRIDVVSGDELVEIQHGSLSAIRDKIHALLGEHRVRVVKPVIGRKHLVKQASRAGKVKHRRLSPKRGTRLDVFEELVHFTRVFPHERLSLDVLLVDVEELRYPGHGRRRRWRKDDQVVEDRRLVEIVEMHSLHRAVDLRHFVGGDLPQPFDTQHLATALDVNRSFAQQIAYCFREMGTTRQVGKRGNTLLYEFADACEGEGAQSAPSTSLSSAE